MGIKQLSALLKDKCKKSIKTRPLSYYANKKIAIDASMFIYQFLIAVRSDNGALGTGDETTSHLVGMFYRTLRLIESGVVPVYVFDGKPPAVKIFELQKRAERREKAEAGLEKAEQMEDKKEIEKYEKRKIKASAQHIDECKRLLDLLGVPYITAPSEAEAFCAYLCKNKFVHGVATEDMDALTFGSPLMLRNFTASGSKKLPIIEYNLHEILTELDIEMCQFIDICIILGCDYSESMKNVGVKKCHSLIKKYGSIEEILANEKIGHVDTFKYREARDVFSMLPNIDVDVPDFYIDYSKVNMEEVKNFLVTVKHFDEGRVTKGVTRLLESKNKVKQTALDSFFKKK